MFCCLSLPSKMKSCLELALECVVGIYHQYAVRWPIDDYLSRREFSLLLKETAQPFLYDTKPVRAERGPALLTLQEWWPPWGMQVAGSLPKGRKGFSRIFLKP